MRQVEHEFRVVGTMWGCFDPEEYRGMTLDEVCESIVETMTSNYPGDLDPEEVMAVAEEILEAANAAD